MTENEKLRRLLAEARERLYGLGYRAFAASDTANVSGYQRIQDEVDSLHGRIDAALAELPQGCPECAMWKEYAENIGLDAVRAAAETYKVVVGERDVAEAALAKCQKERDEARTEVERLRKQVSDEHNRAMTYMNDLMGANHEIECLKAIK